MTRGELEALIFDSYAIKADYPFEGDFETGVFRHADTGRWFGIAMRIPRARLLPSAEGMVDVANFKCAPEIIESLVGNEAGVYRAYHMNKTHWLTVALDECDVETVGWLIGISFELTERKGRTKK